MAALSPALGTKDICLRLLCAMFIGLVIGTEREYTRRPAGMRTHILVALGACVVAITGQLLFRQYSALGASPDPGRLSAQVITGVGFLGAGTILRDGATVKGLTTAASLWAVACLGIAAGCGYHALALLGMVCIFLTLTALEVLQRWLIPHRAGALQGTIETGDLPGALDAVTQAAAKNRGRLRELTVTAADSGFRLAFRAEFPGRGSQKRQAAFGMELLSRCADPQGCSNAVRSFSSARFSIREM